MRKIKKRLAAAAAICILAAGMTACSQINQPDNTETTIAPTGVESSSEPSEHLEEQVGWEELQDTIYGIPSVMFEKTSDRTFPLELTNNKMGFRFTITENAVFNDFHYGGFLQMQNAEEQQMMVEPGKTKLTARKEKKNEDCTIVFGAINEKESADEFGNCRLIYFSCAGNSDWSLCGVTTKMTREEVLQILGEPSRENQASIEYFFLIDGHTYALTISMQEGAVSKVELNVDNHAIS